MKRARTLLKIWLMLAAILLGWQSLARAQQVMVDPTRPPPPGMMAGVGTAAGFSGPLLQSVIITPSGRSAIIGGERVKLGGKYGDAKVIKISEGEVVLHSASGNETLRLYQDIEMKPVRKSAVSK